MAMQKTITNEAAAPTESSTAQTIWHIAVAEYERTKAAHEQAVTAYNIAEGAYFAERKAGQDGRFEGLRRDARRGSNTLIAAYGLVTREGMDEGAALVEAERVVDDYEAFLANDDAARERHNLTALDDAVNATADAFLEAERQLYATPAPDAEAMVAKLDILTAKMVECQENDAEPVAAIRDDASRLFGRAA